MPTSNFSSEQESNQEAALSPSVAETERSVKESLETSTPIRARHILILGGLSAFGPLSTDMYLPALPTLSHDLGATMSQIQITLSACILGLALGQVIAGPISDALGRRRPLLIGVAVYVLASLLCLVAPDVTVLTLLRFVQGFAAAAGIVIATAIARDLYSGIALARCLSLLILVYGIAPILAPVLGSEVFTLASWRGIFVTLAGIGVVLLVATAFGLGETLSPSHRQSGGISASLSAFRDLLTDRRFLGYALALSLSLAAGLVYISASSFVLQNIYGVSPQLFGLLFGINALGLVVVSQVSGRLVGRVSEQTLLTWGVAALAVSGTILLAVVITGIGLVAVVLSFFLLIASLGLVMPNATALALANTRAAGSASAVLGMLQFSIGAIAAPLVGLGGTTTAIPMAAAIAAFGIAALLTFIVFCRSAQATGSERGDHPFS
jgi:DHA1 family bicyclomycin/chloramphenicol resistance-like MFS transporter